MRTALLFAMVLIPSALQEPKLSFEPYQIFQIPAGTAPDDGVSGPITGEVIRETPHVQIYAEKGFLPVDLAWLQVEVERIYDYLVERMGVSTTERFALTFRPLDTAPCPMRGLAHSYEPVGQAIVFANEQTSRSQISGVIAHEFAHLLHSRAFRAGAGDMNLSEGLASWTAGKYWQAWQRTPADNVRAFRVEGRYKPLEEYYRETPSDTDSVSCWKNRDRRYNSWAAFIDFLITEYGMDKFRQLLGPPEDARSELSVTESGFINQTLKPFATLQGTVFGEDGKPASGITITIERQDAKGNYKVPSQKNGTYTYDGLPAGEYMLGVIYKGEAGLLRDATLRTGRIVTSDFDLKDWVGMGKPGSYDDLRNRLSQSDDDDPGNPQMRNVLIERELLRVLADPSTPGVRFPVVPAPAPPPMSDFKAVYGLTLSELEKTWLERLDKMEPR